MGGIKYSLGVCVKESLTGFKGIVADVRSFGLIANSMMLMVLNAVIQALNWLLFLFYFCESSKIAAFAISAMPNETPELWLGCDFSGIFTTGSESKGAGSSK